MKLQAVIFLTAGLALPAALGAQDQIESARCSCCGNTSSRAHSGDRAKSLRRSRWQMRQEDMICWGG